jgi:tripartite-type tricarboxylate transporter receptor subunit TctC
MDYTAAEHQIAASSAQQEEGRSMKTNGWLLLITACFLAGSLPAAHAAEKAKDGSFPNRTIRLIVPFPPGGSNDMLSRYLGAKLTERLGHQVVIDNRAGANGIIGTEIAARSGADGHTLLIASTSYVMNAALRPLPYDIEKSFDPISLIGQAPNSIVVYPGSGLNTLRDLVDRARAKPGALQYASTGVGGFNHFGGELFKKVAGIDMAMVPYKGGGPAMVDVMAGNIPILFTSVTQVLPHVRSGRIRMLAVGAANRVAAVPDVPTVSESGFPGYEVYVWWGIMAPAGVPGGVQEKLHREFTSILKDPDTRKRLAAEAAETLFATPGEFRKMIRDDRRKWTEVAKQARIQVH